MGRGGGDLALLGGDEDEVADDGVFFDILRLPAAVGAQDGVHGRADAGHDRLGVGVDEMGELVAVVAAERPHPDG